MKWFILSIITLGLGTLATAKSRAASVKDAYFVTKDSTKIHYLDPDKTPAPRPLY